MPSQALRNVKELRSRISVIEEVAADGTTDNTTAIQALINTGRSLDFGDSLHSYRITEKLLFNQPNAHYYGVGATLKFDGPVTTRLADVSGHRVTFDGLVFDGNDLQPRFALLQILANTQRPRFFNCDWKDLTGTTTGADIYNSMNGLAISPYGVKDFVVDNCNFINFAKHNDTPVVVTPLSGWGFVSGIVFFLDDINYTDAQPVPTGGVINNTYFENIRTILDDGLSVNDQIELQDADAIRTLGTLGDPAGVTHLYIQINNMRCRDVAKRALKISRTKGVQISNLEVVATDALQYPMVTAVKLDGYDLQLNGLHVFSPSATPVQRVIQTHDAARQQLSNIAANNCIGFWEIAGTDAETVLEGVKLSNVYVDSCTQFGILISTAMAAVRSCAFSNLSLRAVGNDVKLLVLATLEDDVLIANAHFLGGDVKVGPCAQFSNIYQEINNAAYTGSSPTTQVIEVGVNPGTSIVKPTKISDYVLNIRALPDGYFHATNRPTLFSVFGDRAEIDGFTVIVPETFTTAYPHGSFYGHDQSLRNFRYSGKGMVYWQETAKATYGPYKRCDIDGATRNGGVAADHPFLLCGDGQRCTISAVKDLRDAAVGSLRIDGGTAAASDTYAWLIDDVRSATSSGGNPVYGAGIATALVTNQAKF